MDNEKIMIKQFGLNFPKIRWKVIVLFLIHYGLKA